MTLLLSRPRDATVRALATCPGDVVILGAGGKMGPTLARMVRRAAAADGARLARALDPEGVIERQAVHQDPARQEAMQCGACGAALPPGLSTRSTTAFTSSS